MSSPAAEPSWWCFKVLRKRVSKRLRVHASDEADKQLCRALNVEESGSCDGCSSGAARRSGGGSCPANSSTGRHSSSGRPSSSTGRDSSSGRPSSSTGRASSQGQQLVAQQPAASQPHWYVNQLAHGVAAKHIDVTEPSRAGTALLAASAPVPAVPPEQQHGAAAVAPASAPAAAVAQAEQRGKEPMATGPRPARPHCPPPALPQHPSGGWPQFASSAPRPADGQSSPDWMSPRQRYPLRRLPPPGMPGTGAGSPRSSLGSSRRAGQAPAQAAVPATTPAAAQGAAAAAVPVLESGCSAEAQGVVGTVERTTRQPSLRELQTLPRLPAGVELRKAATAGAAASAAAAVASWSRPTSQASLASASGRQRGPSPALSRLHSSLLGCTSMGRRTPAAGTDGFEAELGRGTLPLLAAGRQPLVSTSSTHYSEDAPRFVREVAPEATYAGPSFDAGAAQQAGAQQASSAELAAARAQLAAARELAEQQAKQLKQEARELDLLHRRLQAVQSQLAEAAAHRQATTAQMSQAQCQLAQQPAAGAALLGHAQRQLAEASEIATQALSSAREQLADALEEEALAKRQLEEAEAVEEEWKRRHNRMLCEHRPAAQRACKGDSWWQDLVGRAPFFQDIEVAAAGMPYHNTPRGPRGAAQAALP